MSTEHGAHKPSASDPEMICINCKNYDTVWFNCVLLGFDGIRENPNMRCNVQVVQLVQITHGEAQAFAFQRRTAAEIEEDIRLADKLRGDEPINLE